MSPTLSAAVAEIALPAGVRSRYLDNINGLKIHYLEAGFESAGRPLLVLLHGFPELAYSWRKILPALADAGFHAVAPDQRGYGRTTGWHERYDTDLIPFSILNVARDVHDLVLALGYSQAAAVIGHDFGASAAAWCALAWPTVFQSVVLMSAPFAGLPRSTVAVNSGPTVELGRALASLDPPRKHYNLYYSGREANADMWHPPQGLHRFLKAYYLMKSADWPGNQPHPLKAWSAPELAKLPTYYVMELSRDMPSTVADGVPDWQVAAPCTWLAEDELQVYTDEFTRTGFQGGLNWYRCRTQGINVAAASALNERTIGIPCCFIAGKSDWGLYQKPGELEAMQTGTKRLKTLHIIDGAGHWVQQEQPAVVISSLLSFLKDEVAAKYLSGSFRS